MRPSRSDVPGLLAAVRGGRRLHEHPSAGAPVLVRVRAGHRDEDPDFNTKSLRGNVVLRWEYLRGSTLYVAWNMSTTDDTRPGVFNFSRDFRDAFRAPGTHAVIVKVSYWLSR